MKSFINTQILSMLVIASLLLCLISCATTKKLSHLPVITPGIDIEFSGEQVADTVFVTVAPIPTDTTMFVLDYVEASSKGKNIAIPVIDKNVHISIDSLPSVYSISFDSYKFPSLYLRSNDHANVRVGQLSPLRYEIDGLPYVSQFSHSKDFYNLKSKLWKVGRHKYSEDEILSNIGLMSSLLDSIIPNVNPEVATYILSQLDDDIVVKLFDKLPSTAKNTLHYSHVCALRNTGARAALNQEKIDSDMANSATVIFTLESLDGTTFDISSLRGKWVVLDFWVSWCGPCRRGFEKMKNVYANNTDKLEVVAIACGDQTEEWQRLVRDLELPWTNLLAPSPASSGGTVGGFPVPAYPTKIVIDPDGRMRDFIVGEDEEFYDNLVKQILQN